METFNLAQLTKEMVVNSIRHLADPGRISAGVVHSTLLARLKGHKLSNYEIQEAVIEVCRGAMAGMLLMECPLPKGAAEILKTVARTAVEAEVDDKLMSIAAIKGMADVKRFVTPEALRKISDQLEATRRGAGGVFDRFSVDLVSHLSHPSYRPPA